MNRDDIIECILTMPDDSNDLTEYLRDIRWHPNGNLVLNFSSNPVSLVLSILNRQDKRQRKRKNNFKDPETWMTLVVETTTQRRVYRRAVMIEGLTFWEPDPHIVCEIMTQAA